MGAAFDRFPLPVATRVLLVDDNPKLCRIVKEYLEPLGYDVALAHTGPDGLEKALHGGFHAVILDAILPGMDGFAVLRELRAQSTGPVVMLTGRGDAPDRIAGLELGADDYVPKTYSPRELLARLRTVIRRSIVTAAQAQRAPQPRVAVGATDLEPETREAVFQGRSMASPSSCSTKRATAWPVRICRCRARWPTAFRSASARAKVRHARGTGTREAPTMHPNRIATAADLRLLCCRWPSGWPRLRISP